MNKAIPQLHTPLTGKWYAGSIPLQNNLIKFCCTIWPVKFWRKGDLGAD